MATSMPRLLGRVGRGFEQIRTEPRRWFVLVGDRLVVAFALALAFAAAVGVVSSSGVVASPDSSNVIYLFQAIIAGNMTLLTIVLSINQLVLSRELQSPGELLDQMEDVFEYRHGVEDTTGRAAVPVTPEEFLAVLVDGTRDTTQELERVAGGLDAGRRPAEVDSLVSDLDRLLDRIEAKLERTQGGIFSTLAAMLETNFSHQLHAAYRIETDHGDDLPSRATDLLAELRRSLQQLDVARQYFRSIYVQSELARLSRILLYVGIPAVASALLMLYVYTSAGGAPVPVGLLEVVVPTVVVAGFVPLAVLFSFVIRLAAVGQRTVAILPFTTPEQEFGFHR